MLLPGPLRAGGLPHLPRADAGRGGPDRGAGSGRTTPVEASPSAEPPGARPGARPTPLSRRPGPAAPSVPAGDGVAAGPVRAARTGRGVPGRNRRHRCAALRAGRLPGRGRRSRDVRVSVGVSGRRTGGMGTPGCGALRRTRAAALSRRHRRRSRRHARATGRPSPATPLSAPDRRRLLVLVWGGLPVPARRPASLASALVLHCVDAVLDRLRRLTPWGPSWLLTRSRSRVAVTPCWATPAGCSTVGTRSRTRRPASGWAAGPRSPLN